MVRHFDDALAISHNSRKFTQISRRPRHSLSKPLIVRSYSVNNIDTCGTAESPSIGLSGNDSQVCGQYNTHFQNMLVYSKMPKEKKICFLPTESEEEAYLLELKKTWGGECSKNETQFSSSGRCSNLARERQLDAFKTNPGDFIRNQKGVSLD